MATLARFFQPAGKMQPPPSTPTPQRSLNLNMGQTPPSTEVVGKRLAMPEMEPAMPICKKPRTEPQVDAAGGYQAPQSANKDATWQPGMAANLQNRRHASVSPYMAECFDFWAGGQAYSWPEWLDPEKIRDAQGRRPQDPGYNQSTLLVPDAETQKKSGHGTPMLLQYWKLKKLHFDKIALFKVGKFYELFYYDAFFANRTCGLKWMGEKKPHVGFPEMAKHEYAKQLVAAGYKVVVVEQVERVEENKERNAGTMTCIEREPCEVFTKGTIVDPEMIGGASARYMVYLHFSEHAAPGAHAGTRFAVCLVDCATSQMLVRRVQDGTDRNALRTLMAQVQPGEVVYVAANMPADVLLLLRRLPCRPQLSPLHNELTTLAAKDRLARYRGAHPGKFSQAVEAELLDESTAIAAAGAIEYLETVLLGKRVLPFAIWDVADMTTGGGGTAESTPGSNAGKRMVLDATALSALEVFETLEGTYKGSLLEFLDNTSTPFGFRLLKQWLCAPLFCTEEIRERQRAVEFFIKNSDIATKLRGGLKKVPVDLERATSKVWGYALQVERHAVMYEDITAKRLTEFVGLLQAFGQCLQLLASLPGGDALPRRLAQITRTRSRGGVFPDLHDIITRLSTSVVQLPEPAKNGATRYRPRDGVDPNYDALAKNIANIKAQLDVELKKIQAKLPGVALMYVHRPPGWRYEIECNEGVLPQAFTQQVDMTTATKGKVRFQTKFIQDAVEKLKHLEEKKEDCIFPFLSRLFQEFFAHQAPFRAATRLLAELDALLSLAVASQGLPGTSCWADIVDLPSLGEQGQLELKACRHPVAASIMGASFVPNDAFLNSGGVPGTIVVTGPNMGGKSTVLRQTCIAVVMAQLGMRVNASSCRLSPVDRIFTRIGSYDTILEGKSTLLVELEETAALLRHGTPRSLAVLDELGRGTSTFDGAAIAAAVLDDLASRVHCMVLFATHYHPVSREAVRCKEIAPFHMAASVNEKTHEMTFLYQFLPGLCPASHGHNVAKLAGLPESVLTEAMAKSAEFERGTSGSSQGAELLRLAEQAAAGGGDAGLRKLFQTRIANAKAPTTSAPADGLHESDEELANVQLPAFS
mmetsp:Transcript_6228/g.11330  ORF Transcript_6228/g.11330 Transcript_6228/m.11330 type:complete len:1097 (-) Transcript_6228:71-3361(-)